MNLMKTQALLKTLTDVERAVQRCELSAAQSLLFEAQEWVLQIEREMMDMQARKDDLHGVIDPRGSWRLLEQEPRS